MALASRSGGPLPPLTTAAPLWARPGDAGEEPWEGRQAAVLRGEVPGYARLPVAQNIPGLDLRPGAAPGAASEQREAGSVDWRRELAPGGPIPPTLQRLRTVLLRLHREREQLLQARDYARHLQAAVRLLRTLSTGTPSVGSDPVPQLCRDLRLHAAGGELRRIGLRDTLLARAIGLAAQRLDAAIEMQLVAVGRAPASPSLSSWLADLLQSLPTYHGLQRKALSHVPGAARPFPTARVLRLLAEERGCQMARRLEGALWRSGLNDQLRRQCQEERELLPGLLVLVGGVADAAGSALGLGGAGTLWSQYWTLLWAACAQSLDLNLGPWRDSRVVAKQLDQALGQASLPQECEKELASWCHSLCRQSLIGSWDQGFCQALGSALGDPSSLPGASHTAQLLQQLFPPLLDALRQPESGLLCGQLPGPAPIALALCTLQTTLLWLLGRAQRHLAAWAPGPFLLLIQKDLPPLLREVEALSRLTSEETSGPEAEQQLNLEMHRLATRIQSKLTLHWAVRQGSPDERHPAPVAGAGGWAASEKWQRLLELLPEESLGLFSEACHKQATQGFKLHMPRGRYWRPRLCSELPSVPSEYAGLVVRTVLEPVLQGLQGLSPQAQVPALGPALTATLRAWLDHILTCGIRFSLQGALQLRQDFGVVKELLEEEQWGLSPELRQSLFMLSIFQQLDGAILCLLQQPLPKTRVGRRRLCCCTCTDIQTTELPSSCLNSLENLEPSLRPGTLSAGTVQLLSSLRGGGPSPEAYLVGNQQAWLALRQHQDSRWHLTFLACLGISPES